MNATKEKELTEVYQIQAFGNRTKIHMKILLDVGRNLTSTDNNNIRECAEKLSDLLSEETIKVDPRSKEEATKERQEILELFKDHAIFVEEIPNGYSNGWYSKHLPWFVVTTKLGRITIGWRKRVINIDWEGSIINKTANELFPGEDVTKGNKCIHAWSYEKAKEYIDVLLK